MAAGSLSLSDLVVFLLYVSYFTQPIQSLVNTSQLSCGAAPLCRRYEEILETRPEAPQARKLSGIPGERFGFPMWIFGTGKEMLCSG